MIIIGLYLLISWPLASQNNIHTSDFQSIIANVQLSPDGEYIVGQVVEQMNYRFLAKTGQMATKLVQNHRIYVWNRSGKVINMTEPSALIRLNFSPDGQHIAFRETGELWDFKQNKINDLAADIADFSPNGKWLLTLGEGTLENLRAGWRYELSPHHQSVLQQGSFSADNQWLVTTLVNSPKALIWNMEGEVFHTIENDIAFRAAHFSPNALYILTLDQNNYVKIWDIADWDNLLLTHFTPNASLPTIDVDFLPNGRCLYTTHPDVQRKGLVIKIWDLMGDELLSLSHNSLVFGQQNFSPDGKKVIIAQQSSALVFDLSEKQLLQLPHNQLVTSVSFAADGRQMVSSTVGKTLAIPTDLYYEPPVGAIIGEEAATARNSAPQIFVWNERGERVLVCVP